MQEILGAVYFALSEHTNAALYMYYGSQIEVYSKHRLTYIDFEEDHCVLNSTIYYYCDPAFPANIIDIIKRLH